MSIVGRRQNELNMHSFVVHNDRYIENTALEAQDCTSQFYDRKRDKLFSTVNKTTFRRLKR